MNQAEGIRDVLRGTAIVSMTYGAAALAGALIIGTELLRVPHATLATLLDHWPFLVELETRHPGLLAESLKQLAAIRLSLLLLLALLYAAVRAVEAYGLWTRRRWGEWFCALSALLYVPFELDSIGHGATWLNLGSLLMNLGVIALMVYALKKNRRVA